MMALRILSIIDVFSFIPAGGAGTYLFETCKQFVKRGNKVVVVCRRRKDIPLDGEIQGVYFRSFEVANLNNLFCQINGLKNLIKIFLEVENKFRPDVVYAHHSLGLNIYRIFRKRKIPIFYVFHSPWHREYLTRRFGLRGEYNITMNNKIMAYLRRKSDEIVLKNADVVITLSEYMKSEARKIYNAVSSKVRFVPGGADVNRFDDSVSLNEAKKKLGFDEKHFIISTVRSLIPRTGIDKLLVSAKIIAQKIKDFKLVICGDGPMRQALESLVRNESLNDIVKFEGAVLNENLPAYYQASDLFVMPSQDLEGFGLALMEAMSCGVPAVVTPVGGMVDVIKKFNPRLITSDTSSQSIAEKIMEFYEKMRFNISLRKECREFIVENYRWDITASNLLEIFHKSGA